MQDPLAISASGSARLEEVEELGQGGTRADSGWPWRSASRFDPSSSGNTKLQEGLGPLASSAFHADSQRPEKEGEKTEAGVWVKGHHGSSKGAAVGAQR